MFFAAALLLNLELVRHSLTGTHLRYRDTSGAEVNVTVRRDGSCEGDREICDGARALVLHDERSLSSAQTGVSVLHPARVFDFNPVEKLNDPSLQDRNNSPTAVPERAYADVELQDVNPSGPLGGPYVQIADLQPPAIAPIDASQSLVLDRSQTGFEDVNAYFHIDRSQRYLQSLGYAGNRAIAPYPVQVDTHAASGEDNSFFLPVQQRPGEGMLFFGDGGTDDAEDSDLVVHEYAHAIHEWISPGTFLGAFSSEGRAISEGFADYWAFSASYGNAVSSGRDPFCIADWDARCWEDASSEHCAYAAGSDCLRRVDSTKTVHDFARSDNSGTEYLNGAIWSSALRSFFVAMTQRYGVEVGKRSADAVVIESLFGAPPNPAFAGIARKMIAADRYLKAGANADLICAAMMQRGVLADCAVLPRGELTVFESRDRGIPIPDNDPTGVTLRTTLTDARPIDRVYVRVDVDHPFRADLEIVLIAPDGTQVTLMNASGDKARDVHATFGRDAVPVGSLDVFRGRSEAGEWRLRISDVRPRDVGVALSWGLVVQFAGDRPLADRPDGTPKQFIPVVGHVPGANGTFFRTDLRIENPGSQTTTATLVFTPSGGDGLTQFSSVNVEVPAGRVVTLNDIVGGTFGTEGLGQLEIIGDVVVASRTYTRNASGGTLGEFIPPAQGRSSGFLIRLYNTSEFRSNIGFAETSGTGGRIRVSTIDVVTGSSVSVDDYDIKPYGHLQVPVTAPNAVIASYVSSTDVVAYASIVDNVTGDATYFTPDPQRSRLGLAPAINGSGIAGTSWTTDVWLSVPVFSGIPGSEPLTYTPATTRQAIHQSIPWSRETRLVDVVRLTFFAQGTRGVISTRIGESPVIKSAVIANGGYRQSVTFLTPVSDVQDLPYIESSDAFRTNVGLMTDTDTVVRVILFDAAGNELDASIHELAANELDQFLIDRRVIDGFVRVVVMKGRVAAYASVVDNITGDASFVPAQVVQPGSAPGL